MKKINFLKSALILLIAFSFNACDEGGEPSREDIGGTNTKDFSGDWFITLTDTDGNTLVEHALHSTYNTAANDNTMWIDDHENGYYIKSKYVIDINSGIFSATDVPNINDGGDNTSTVTITEGQIIKYGAVSKGGHPVDKIHFRVHYSYDADGYDIIYDGHKRTGFVEDEY